jgi:hypothetical protein
MSFLDIIWFIIVWSVFVAYLMFLFRIIGDLFRDPENSGMTKALWMIALVLVPFLTAFVYLVTRGGGMAQRAAEDAASRQDQQAAYIRSVAGTDRSATAQITQAKQLLDSGAITPAEYDRLKTAALN